MHRPKIEVTIQNEIVINKKRKCIFLWIIKSQMELIKIIMKIFNIELIVS